MDIPDYVLIIASSGRMLAEAAAKAGLKPLVIDLYADLDTRSYAVAVRQVASLTREHIAPALADLIDRYGVQHFIYGSGFENHPESLIYLNEHLTLSGNTPDVFVRLQNKAEFFSVLDALNIPYPGISFKAPDRSDNWLVKPMQGQGGVGIKRYDPQYQSASGSYWQKFQSGTPHSVLFLADGQQAQVVGFNRQWTVGIGENSEFIFSGLMNHCDLAKEQKALVADWLTKCVRSFALKGLNSLDFIHDGEQSHVLEINPRPSASMQLYDDLLIRHIAASQGVLTDYLQPSSDFRAYQIVYAPLDLRIPARFEWPEWSMDRPKAGVRCRKGQPLCSIIAHQNGSQVVLEQLAIRQQQLINQMIKVQLHGI
jgi:methenyltetrahydromethanopterin cyclohydrolase